MEKHPPVLQTVRLIALDSKTEQFYSFERAPYTLGYPVYSTCFVCPVCRSIWAEVRIDRGGRDDHIYQPRGVSCESCFYLGPRQYEWLSTLPGSLLDNGIICPDGVDWSMLEAMPKPLVEREFRLLLKAFNKYPQAFPYF